MPRVIALGDIHGCATALAALIQGIQPAADDLVISLGDAIDYGPDSRGVLEQLAALSSIANFVLVRGNHEDMLLDVLDGPRSLETWTSCGGDRTLASYGVRHPSELLASHLQMIRSSRFFWGTDTHLFVHAGYHPNLPLKDTPASVLFWEPFDPKTAWPHCSNKTVVVGHTPQTSGDILDLGFVVCLDTDCSRGGWLSALDTISGRYWQANERGEVREGDRRCR